MLHINIILTSCRKKNDRKEQPAVSLDTIKMADSTPCSCTAEGRVRKDVPRRRRNVRMPHKPDIGYWMA